MLFGMMKTDALAALAPARPRALLAASASFLAALLLAVDFSCTSFALARTEKREGGKGGGCAKTGDKKVVLRPNHSPLASCFWNCTKNVFALNVFQTVEERCPKEATMLSFHPLGGYEYASSNFKLIEFTY